MTSFRTWFFLLLLQRGPVEIVLEDEADALHSICLAERVLVNGMRISFGTQFTVLGEHILYIQITEHGLVADVVIAIAEVAVDKQAANRVNLELRLIFLRGVGAFTVGSEIKSHAHYIRQS